MSQTADYDVTDHDVTGHILPYDLPCGERGLWHSYRCRLGILGDIPPSFSQFFTGVAYSQHPYIQHLTYTPSDQTLIWSE